MRASGLSGEEDSMHSAFDMKSLSDGQIIEKLWLCVNKRDFNAESAAASCCGLLGHAAKSVNKRGTATI